MDWVTDFDFGFRGEALVNDAPLPPIVDFVLMLMGFDVKSCLDGVCADEF